MNCATNMTMMHNLVLRTSSTCIKTRMMKLDFSSTHSTSPNLRTLIPQHGNLKGSLSMNALLLTSLQKLKVILTNILKIQNFMIMMSRKDLRFIFYILRMAQLREERMHALAMRKIQQQHVHMVYWIQVWQLGANPCHQYILDFPSHTPSFIECYYLLWTLILSIYDHISPHLFGVKTSEKLNKPWVSHAVDSGSTNTAMVFLLFFALRWSELETQGSKAILCFLSQMEANFCHQSISKTGNCLVN
jgi:hypothetical protein